MLIIHPLVCGITQESGIQTNQEFFRTHGWRAAVITYRPLALGLGKVSVLLAGLKIIGSYLLTFHTRHNTHTKIQKRYMFFRAKPFGQFVKAHPVKNLSVVQGSMMFHGFCRSAGGKKKTKEPWQKPLKFPNPNYSKCLNHMVWVQVDPLGLVAKNRKFDIHGLGANNSVSSAGSSLSLALIDILWPWLLRGAAKSSFFCVPSNFNPLTNYIDIYKLVLVPPL